MHADRERRLAPRAPFHDKVMLRTRSGKVFSARGDNLSERGMLFRASSEDGISLPTDQQFWLTFTLPKIPQMLQVGARVVRRQHNAREIVLGVEFTKIPADIRRMVRTFVFTGTGEVRNYTPQPSLHST